jgi:hypothetical protein
MAVTKMSLFTGGFDGLNHRVGMIMKKLANVLYITTPEAHRP